jgi:hypothetical protein|nr:MAG TPA: hypothetical protein [Caudoviricetes sp.]
MTLFDNLMRDAMQAQPIVKKTKSATMDSCDTGEKKKVSMDDAGGDYAVKNIKLQAVSTLQQWAETEADDLDEGETLADRLIAMFVGIADANKDGEITEDEQGVIEVAMNAAWDYLTSKGVSDEDCEALFNDADKDAAERVRDLLAEELPEGDEADEDIDNFVFSEEDQEPLLDCVSNAVLDAVYKKTFAIRKGKKVRINKRVSGKVRLSAKQKVAIRKAQMKSHSAAAQMRRMKSMRIRRKSGLK